MVWFNLGLGAALVYEVEAKFCVLVFIILIFLILSWHLRISVYRVLRGEGLHRLSTVTAVSSCVRQRGELDGSMEGKDFLCTGITSGPISAPCLGPALSKVGPGVNY